MTKENSTTRSQTKTSQKRTGRKPSANPGAPVARAVEADRPEKIIPKEVDLNQYITVKNGYQGRLVYKSSRTGEKFVWNSFGDEQEIELKELRNAKNTSKGFFVNNWFMFDDLWVLDYLGVRNYYKYVVKIEDFDKLFDKEPNELANIVSTMSAGQRRSVIYRANELISSGKIDSRRTIAALEESLGVELIEH